MPSFVIQRISIMMIVVVSSILYDCHANHADCEAPNCNLAAALAVLYRHSVVTSSVALKSAYFVVDSEASCIMKKKKRQQVKIGDYVVTLSVSDSVYPQFDTAISGID